MAGRMRDAKVSGRAPYRVIVVNTGGMAPGGITYNMLNYLTEIAVDGRVAVTVVATIFYDEYMIAMFRKAGCEVVCLPDRNARPLKYFFELCRLLSRGRFDAIHVHGSSGMMALEMLAAKLAGVGTRIAHSHNTSTNHPSLHRILLPVMQSLTTKRLACGKRAGEWLHGRREFEVLNNGVDLARFAFDETNRNTVKEESGWGTNPIVGHVGTFTDVKNQEFIIDVFAELLKRDDSCRLLLLGDGPLRERIERKCIETGLRDKVRFTGTVNDTEKYLSAMDAVIMPSLYEGLPLTLVEEQANGLSCLISDTITEEIDMTGNVVFMSLKEDKGVWAEKLNDLLERAGSCDRAAKSEKACADVGSNRYDIRKEAERLLAIYGIEK